MLPHPKSANTIVYVWHLYKDFQAAGPFVLGYILGGISGWIYYSFRIRPTLRSAGLWAQILGFIAFSFLVPFWGFAFVYMGMVILYFAHRYLKVHEKVEAREI